MAATGVVGALAACGSAGSPEAGGPVDEVGLSPRQSPALAWVGDRLFVYGGAVGTPDPVGDDPFAGAPRSPEGVVLARTDGALFDVEAPAMERLAEAPFPDPVQYPEAIAVDDEVVVLGIDCPRPNPDPEDTSGTCEPGTYAAAVYSVTDAEWREVTMPAALDGLANGATEPVGATSDGRAVFVLGPRDDVIEQLWAYTPADDRWERLPSPEVRVDAQCLAGDTVAVMSGSILEDVGEPLLSDTDPQPRGWVGYVDPTLHLLTLTDDELQWRITVAAEEAPLGTAIAQLDCTDDMALFRNTGSMPQFHSVLSGYERDDWLVPSPSPAEGHFSHVLGIGDRMIFFNSNNIQSAVYDPATDEWQLLEGDLAVQYPVWTGDAITGWPGGDGAVQPQYFPFRPIS